jgi:glycosyltransferase involved in cell wall biosynthesis
LLCSIIIAHYNRPKKLERLLKTIPLGLEQNIEVIVIDDLSVNSDEKKAKKICGNFSDVRFLQNDIKRKGPGGARNLGLELAKGKWIIIADSDDRFDKENLKKLLINLENQDNDLIFFGVDEFGEGSRKRVARLNALKDEILENKIIIANDYGASWGIAYKREIIKKSKAKFLEGIFIGEDAPFSLLCISLSQKVGIIDEIIYHVENHEESLTHLRLSKKKRTKLKKSDFFSKFINKLELATTLYNLDRDSYEHYVTYRLKPLNGVIKFNFRLIPIWSRYSKILNKSLFYYVQNFFKKNFKSNFKFVEKITLLLKPEF